MGARKEISGAPTEMIVPSLATDEIPEDWRITCVVPLFDNGRRDKPGKCH